MGTQRVVSLGHCGIQGGGLQSEQVAEALLDRRRVAIYRSFSDALRRRSGTAQMVSLSRVGTTFISHSHSDVVPFFLFPSTIEGSGWP